MLPRNCSLDMPEQKDRIGFAERPETSRDFKSQRNNFTQARISYPSQPKLSHIKRSQEQLFSKKTRQRKKMNNFKK